MGGILSQLRRIKVGLDKILNSKNSLSIPHYVTSCAARMCSPQSILTILLHLQLGQAVQQLLASGIGPDRM